MERLQRYRLLERIAEGGMGEVFRAEASGAHGFAKQVAVKRVLPELARDAELEARFVAEAKLAVALSHANVVQVLDLARAGDDLFLVMELVDGADLGTLVRAARARGEAVPAAVALRIAAEALAGLDHAHRHGVVHCDVSPSNLLLSRAGEVKVADFGVARLASSRAARVAGTPRYMAPEQRAGGAVDGRADLFALAEVIAEALGGDREAPPALAELLSRARSSDPAARPASAAAMLGELARIARDEATVTAPELGAWVERLLGAPGGGPAHDRFGEALGEVLRVGAPPAHTLTGDGAAPLALRTTFVAERGAGGLTVWRRERPRPWAAIAAAAAVAAIAAGAGGWALARTGTAVGTGTAAGTGTAVGTGTAAGTGAAVGTGTGTDGVAGIEKEAAIEKGVAIKKEAKAGAAGGAAAARRSPGVGYLNVYAEPWAKVSVDGRDVGATPLMKLALPAGSHRVRLEHSPAAPVERMVSLTAGRTELLDVDLEHE